MPPTSTRLIRAAGPEWDAAHQQARVRGLPLPAAASPAWRRAEPGARHWLLVLDGTPGERATALGLRVDSSRALPGHCLVRAERLLAAADSSFHAVVAPALARLSRAEPRILRMSAEVTALGAEALAAAGAAYREAGFVERPARNWARTLVVDLTPDEDAIRAGFSQKPRRDLRSAEKLPIVVRAVDDPRWAPRMEALLATTYSRTGGRAEPGDWPSRIALARDEPALTRLVGLFRTDRDDDRSLLAFTWGIFHGDHATYEIGASERQDDIKVPLLTPLLWELMRWARSHGAGWFDLGGVSEGSQGSADPLGGISDFKRLFSKVELDIGTDWVLEPHPMRARVAHAVSRFVGR